MADSQRLQRLERYRAQSLLADNLAESGKTEETLALLREQREQATAAGDEDYRLFFEAELVGYGSSDYETQLALLDQALAYLAERELPPDYFLLRSKGAYLSLLGKQEEAIVWFDKALAVKPDDHNALRDKGVALDKLNKEEEALVWYDKALVVKPGDYNALRNKGVALGKLNREEEALVWFDKALAIKSDDYNALRNKGVALDKLNREEEALVWFDKALAVKPDDYNALRDKGVALGKLNKKEEALVWFDKALAVKPDDHDALRNKGIALSKLGKEQEALEWFDKALAAKPDDHDALRQKGVSLGKLDKEEEALVWFDKALAVKPDDHYALREKGLSLSKLGKVQEALEWFDKALAVKPDDHGALRNKGVALSMQGDHQAAIELYQQALLHRPDSADIIREWAVAAYNSGNPTVACEKISLAAQLEPQKYQADFITIFRLAGNDPDAAWQQLFSQPTEIPPPPHDRLQDIRDFVGTIRKNLGEKGQEFLSQKEAAEKNVAKFLKPESLLSKERSFFLVLRKWNSYTPAIPTDTEERSRGGGYFIYHNGKGTVIDPGYNFIENFHQAGCRIHDIDNIVITHAHNDHTIDFESICTLLHQYNAKARKDGKTTRKISLYFNNGAFKKFSGLLNLMDKNFVAVRTLNADNSYQIQEGLTLTVLPANHDEVVSRDQSIGMLFTFAFGEETRKIVFTSDTGLFPLCADSDGLKPDTKGKELWDAYPSAALEDIDLLVAHIGSIKTEELNVDLNDDIGKCLYPNHLGMIGTARMITKLRPKLALVSEFGEEMRNFRRDIVKRIEEDVVCKVLKDEPLIPRVAPADLAFMYDIGQVKFLCCADYKWVDVSEISYNYGDGSTKEDLYYFCQDTIDPSDYRSTVAKFRQYRKDRLGLYFAKQAADEEPSS